ncbi:MAG: UDP-N-acetylglucosamine--N-acetylmuramyl-(pentapeptide) pyrophosphoryl-undecaprenol N-acetylglucosamine transferase [Alphaproteobacteria bacterium MarineAlpha5_Bin11]|nr:undecaprenyldiphospho-muramoylpentapeptide beta-N-acetylglucosaminyltransferase [Pelagibacteraceae bacterium]PPR42649.1 MAG: UDP-N-acetylglucosamine--N-acetylmuramyl-(pentapeptide) pyrophosphoryl-undecaprenol N-acetylglucosamine transferase [Alphaproteobacteria bacterium MarineAlpha5_Bin11]PPR51637.1 MAG: UDP-N-acetylglucosamine--N-acetylmuramyl-(pentapeptide) pyrophosphoryl-undecaprenol N-acetylglucosamine transferase [Alphaproteobacteria bacterium MarineAlpha5_Bin10]|tara:strand:- start:2896 stop:3999 length:1104 start_codon:yes stop_codon:yes gene_type:complete
MNKKYDIFIVTGGTGGHIFPALSFSDSLNTNNIKNLIITDQRGIKYFNANKYETKKILSSHLDKNFFKKIIAFLYLITGFIQFTILFIKQRPKYIITFGSYASFSAILCSVLFKRIFSTKLYFHEQNSIIGKVHKLFLFSAEYIFTTYPETIGINKKYEHKILYTGIPLRREIKKFQEKKVKTINKMNKINILIFGGSQGSSNLSKLMINLLFKLTNNYQNQISLIIQSPQKDLKVITSQLNKTNIEYKISDFFEDIFLQISRADLCICRSGSLTVNELIALSAPSILVPLPTSSHNHQYYNARFLSDKKGSIIIEEKDLMNDKTLKILENILLNPNTLNSMISNLNKMKKMDPNPVIKKIIFKNVN